MTNEKKIELFETLPIPKAVAKLAVPTILSSLVMVIYNLADTFFVGTLNDPVESAAVTLAAPVLLAFNAIINLFGVGTGSYMSRALGKKDYDTVRHTSAYGFYCALLCSLLFSLCCVVFHSGLLHLLGADARTEAATSDYLFWTVSLGAAPSILNVILANLIRSEGESLHASVGTMSGCFLNILLDPVFIMSWGLDMGAAGAGCATFISNCVACAYFFVFLIRKRGKTYVSLDPRKCKPQKEIVLAVAAVGIPAAVQNLLNVTGMTVLNNFTSAFGTDAVAAMGITHKINMVPMYFSMGLGQGIMPLVGYNYASGNGQRMKKSITFTAKIAVGFILAATVAYYFCAGPLITLFMKKAAIVAYGTRFLRGFCLGLPFLCVDFLAVGIFQAVGMGKESFLFAVLRKVALEIPALYILNKLWPLYGLSYSQLCAEVVLAAAAVLVLRQLFHRVDEREAQNELRSVDKNDAMKGEQ
ncbi:MAG: MATE family efflux transporter [Clostridiales bacterium]|nr:MATE family efflux transporter [Candidatus Cacconaster stercorequi]